MRSLFLILLIVSLGMSVFSCKEQTRPDNTGVSRSHPDSQIQSVFIPDLNTSYHPGKSVSIPYSGQESNIDGYVLHLPVCFHSYQNPIPILLFLQGSGATGGEIDRVNLYGIPQYLAAPNQLDTRTQSYLQDSFIVVSPHVSVGAHIDEEEAIKAVINELVTLYHGDSQRVYLTGLSFGGFSTWGLANKRPELFAAVAPMAGGNWTIQEYESMKDLPIWVSHCTGDPDMPYEPIHKAVTILEEVNQVPFIKFSQMDSLTEKDLDSPFLFSTFDRNSHDAWSEVYQNPDFYHWLLSHQLPRSN